MAERGFVISENLKESDNSAKDARIINNLGGEGTSDNFSLFSGNFRRESIVGPENYTHANGIFTVDSSNGFVAFSNDTQIIFRENNNTVNTGTVILSDGLQKFRVVDGSNNDIIPSANTFLVRSDVTTSENIRNLRPNRIQVIFGADEERDIISSGDNEEDVFNVRTISENYDQIDLSYDFYNFKKQKIPIGYANTNFQDSLIFDGTVRIVNDSNVPRSNTSPGIFIVQDGSPSRAFGDTSNPWSTSSNTTISTANASVSVLKMQNPEFETITDSANSGVVSVDATHTLPVQITNENGVEETYFLLLKTT